MLLADGPRLAVTRLARALLAALALAAVAGACGPSDTSGGTDEVVAGPATTVPGACVVGPGPSGPRTDAAGGVVQDVGRDHADEALRTRGFDWDGDGVPDRLGFDSGNETVTVDWGSGSLVVGGVPSDFTGEPGNPVLPGGEPFLDQPDAQGAPSEEARAEGLAAPAPAAVAEVTGDGRPDLVVVAEGTVTVLVGAGPDERSRTVALAEVGDTEPGWRNPPVVPTPPPGFTDTEQVPVPYDQATVVPVADLDGDGVADLRVDSVLPRARGPVAYYSGKPCG